MRSTLEKEKRGGWSGGTGDGLCKWLVICDHHVIRGLFQVRCTMMSLEEENEKYFDKHSHSYNGGIAGIMAEKVSRVFREMYEFCEEKTIMMDYACGTGKMSRLVRDD